MRRRFKRERVARCEKSHDANSRRDARCPLGCGSISLVAFAHDQDRARRKPGKCVPTRARTTSGAPGYTACPKFCVACEAPGTRHGKGRRCAKFSEERHRIPRVDKLLETVGTQFFRPTIVLRGTGRSFGCVLDPHSRRKQGEPRNERRARGGKIKCDSTAKRVPHQQITWRAFESRRKLSGGFIYRGATKLGECHTVTCNLGCEMAEHIGPVSG
jgi:hypothetical protein